MAQVFPTVLEEEAEIHPPTRVIAWRIGLKHGLHLFLDIVQRSFYGYSNFGGNVEVGDGDRCVRFALEEAELDLKAHVRIDRVSPRRDEREPATMVCDVRQNDSRLRVRQLVSVHQRSDDERRRPRNTPAAVH